MKIGVMQRSDMENAYDICPQFLCFFHFMSQKLLAHKLYLLNKSRWTKY